MNPPPIGRLVLLPSACSREHKAALNRLAILHAGASDLGVAPEAVRIVAVPEQRAAAALAARGQP